MRGVLCAAAALVAGLLLAGCVPTSGAGRELQGEWRLIEASDRRGAMDLQDAVVTLSIEGDTVRGEGPCNIVQLEIDGGPGAVAVTIGPMTERACLDENLMAIEGRYVTVLSNVVYADVTDGTMVLRGKSGRLTYARQ